MTDEGINVHALQQQLAATKQHLAATEQHLSTAAAENQVLREGAAQAGLQLQASEADNEQLKLSVRAAEAQLTASEEQAAKVNCTHDSWAAPTCWM